MGSTRRSFTDEYKKTAVEFVVNDKRSIADVAGHLKISTTTLGNWVKKHGPENNDDANRPLDKSEREELERLREEVRRVRMEAEFAKKVAAWFAKEQQ